MVKSKAVLFGRREKSEALRELRVDGEELRVGSTFIFTLNAQLIWIPHLCSE